MILGMRLQDPPFFRDSLLAHMSLPDHVILGILVWVKLRYNTLSYSRNYCLK